jgi:hypothetical protein
MAFPSVKVTPVTTGLESRLPTTRARPNRTLVFAIDVFQVDVLLCLKNNVGTVVTRAFDEREFPQMLNPLAFASARESRDMCTALLNRAIPFERTVMFSLDMALRVAPFPKGFRVSATWFSAEERCQVTIFNMVLQ